MWTASIPLVTTGRAAVVGRAPLILHADYDPAQTWLGFMEGTILLLPPEKPEPEKPREGKVRGQTRFAFCSAEDRRLFHYEPGQHVLPFSQRVSVKEFKRLRQADFPGWDRDARGEILTVALRRSVVTDEGTDGAYRALETVAKGRFHLRATAFLVHMERLDDAAKVRVLFGE